MQEYDQHNLTKAVIARLADTPNARTREIMTSLVQHMHDFAREVRLTEAEFRKVELPVRSWIRRLRKGVSALASPRLRRSLFISVARPPALGSPAVDPAASVREGRCRRRFSPRIV